MINNVSTTSPRYLDVVAATSTSYINAYPRASAPAIAGAMRYGVTPDTVEYYNGQMWVSMPVTKISVSVTDETKQVLHWAQKKMIEEKELLARLEKYPALKTAFDQFKIIDALTIEESNNNGT